MKYKLFIILIFLYQISNSQIKEHKYLGTIIVENNQPMSFSLDLIEKDGKVVLVHPSQKTDNGLDIA